VELLQETFLDAPRNTSHALQQEARS